MPHINLLSPHVADLIAAGEVVERPASVIKELMENAFDAGAKNVTVEIRDGGATMIRITDDGCGMAPEDAGIAFLRHATSKLRDEHGLEAIETMGFRGEALAAISAVSHIELYTRRPEDTEGTYMALTAGDIDEMEPTGCPAGTSICVRDLFFNTPARLKFLKSDRSEASACVQAGLRCALGRPEISVRFLRDGKEEFFTPGDGQMSSASYALLGREIASTLLPVQSADEGIRLQGFISSPAAGRGNRSTQYFYVNGRFIRSTLLQTALEQAYKNTLLTGRYPACVVYLEIRPGAVDVNVHPAKIEVKFTDERRVFNLLYQAARDTLLGENRIAKAETPEEEQNPVPAETGTAAAENPAATPENAGPAAAPQPAPTGAAPKRETVYEYVSAPLWKTAAEPIQTAPGVGTVLPRPQAEPATGPVRDQQPPLGFGTADNALPEADAEARENSAAIPPETGPVENPVQDVDTFEVPDHKIVGEALKTYIIVEVGDQIILIDKHAAHERMNFDRLKANRQPIPVQQLLIPQTLRVTAEEQGLLEEYGALFEEFGFEIEPFGENAVILRGVPADMLPDDAVPAVEEILEHLREGGTPDPMSARDELLHTVACKAAIKAGWNTGTAELEKIAREVLSGRVKYCPHGRPVSATVTRKELDKLFLRIV
ncbi:MAG: DNA mismatch repair endonuclease MutL [Oscillospiraceae bacterium]|nr:DNA mismatch repair endonuclease MutL [Oscillospiraceae bacterium]